MMVGNRYNSNINNKNNSAIGIARIGLLGSIYVLVLNILEIIMIYIYIYLMIVLKVS